MKCPQCGFDLGLSHGDTVRIAQKEAQRQGLCIICKMRPLVTKQYCSICLKKHREAQQKYLERRR